MRRSTPIFTLNRERVPLAFQVGNAGSIPVTRSTENPLHSKGFRAPTAVACSWNVDHVSLAGPYVPQRHAGTSPASWPDSTVEDNPPKRPQIRRLASGGATTPTARDFMAPFPAHIQMAFDHAPCASSALWSQAGLETWRVVGGQFPPARCSSMIAAGTRPRAEIS
jgi:hypothetical protein